MRMIRRIAYLWRLRVRGAELEEELSFHRDALERNLAAQGHSPIDASRMARRAMGNELYMREEARGVWLSSSLEAVWQDVKIAVRGLGRRPGFTAGVMLTFALGVGANATMFSLIDRMMFRPPALMRDSDLVHRVYLYRTERGVQSRSPEEYARHADLVRWTTSFSDIAAHSLEQLPVGAGRDTREMHIAAVSASFFDFFDAPPVAGRYFTAAEDAPPAGAPVAVLSHATWKKQYGGAAGVVGSTLQIGAVVYTIVGVAPEAFVGLWPFQQPAAFVPVATHGASVVGSGWQGTYTGEPRSAWAAGLRTLVRRRPGVSIEAANADLTRALRQSYRSEHGADPAPSDDHVRAFAGSVLMERGPDQSSVAKIATWLGGVTIIVLLIACANVASLLLARALERRREIAVRLALGVSRVRLMSQLLSESMSLAVLGGLAGIAVAVWMSAMLSASLGSEAGGASMVIEMRTLVFVGIVTLAVGVFTGLLPVMQARRLALTEDLKSGVGAGSSGGHARGVLLVTQISLALVLLVGAGLFVGSMNKVRAVHLGFDMDSVLVVELAMRDAKLDSARMVALRERLLDAASTVPGVEHASLQQSVPFAGMMFEPIAVDGIDSVSKLGRFDRNAVSPGYFATMGTRILHGRSIESDDVAGNRRVMVISASMAAVLWAGEDPLGKCVRIGLNPQTQPCTYVIGVAEDIRTESLGPESSDFYYYLSAAQISPERGGLLVRVSGDPGRFVEPLRRRLQEEMPGSAFITVTRLAENIEGLTRSSLVGARVFTAFGGLALLLAAVGLYSVIAYDVAQRKQELAIRMALGAKTLDVAQLVVTQGLGFAVPGILLGGGIALVAARWAQPLLFDQSARDPAVFGMVIAALLLVTVLASAIPAVRSARVNPNTALRGE